MLISPLLSKSKYAKKLDMTLFQIFDKSNIDIENKIYELQIESLMNEEEIDLPNLRFFNYKSTSHELEL